MAQFEHKPNTGSAFKNVSENENAPAYKGQLNVEGKLYDLALWVKEGTKGKFFTVKVSEPFQPSEGKSKPKAPEAKKPNPNNHGADDMPF